jgi:hypothetical protein
MYTYFIVQKHDNRIRYKFFNLEHLLLYINNIQIQLNINTQKLQSSLIIRRTKKKKTTKKQQDEIYECNKICYLPNDKHVIGMQESLRIPKGVIKIRRKFEDTKGSNQNA